MRRPLTPMTLAAVAIVILVAGCAGGGPATGEVSEGYDRVNGCHPTSPPSPGFEAPEGRVPSASPASEGDEPLVWYGSPALWTVLEVDGTYTERKSVWWSTDFPGGDVEEQPEISVVATRLDGEAESLRSAGRGTNGFTDAQGWFMIADFPSILPEGCWEITGTYKGASLGFVVDIP